MNQPPRSCTPDAFRILHKLCARLTRKTPYTLYLAVLHASGAERIEEALPRLLHNGEVFCRMQPQSIYLLLFAHSDGEVENRLAPLLAEFPRCTMRVQRVTQRVTADPNEYE